MNLTDADTVQRAPALRVPPVDRRVLLGIMNLVGDLTLAESQGRVPAGAADRFRRDVLDLHRGYGLTTPLAERVVQALADAAVRQSPR